MTDFCFDVYFFQEYRQREAHGDYVFDCFIGKPFVSNDFRENRATFCHRRNIKKHPVSEILQRQNSEGFFIANFYARIIVKIILNFPTALNECG